ncbi:MAG: bifunctional folylpolyglutamate synthase/dihydrofolate synthase [Elusimicrobia bacterium]|nr:bifunctional folylpolyglutamate synthase/dihydrofolate synthase [Elusimicrobiota bacterium]
MRKLAHRLGHPERNFRAIHVTGTNGKGSVCSLLDSILNSSGIKTGLYTSPHLADLRERICVQGKKISKRSLDYWVEWVRSRAGRLEKDLTYFEVLTAAAFCYFSQKKVDLAVLEVGLGGRWDATNVIPAPELCVLTNVSLEHTHFLGNTIQKIAREKAGIVKEGSLCLTAASGPALKVIQSVCKEKNVNLIPISNRKKLEDWLRLCSLKGDFQRENMEIVLNAVEQLREKGWNIPSSSLREGLQKAQWPCRFEWRRLPIGSKVAPVLLDGAHNPAAMEACVRSIRQTPFCSSKVLLVFNALQDKNVSAMAEILCKNLKLHQIFIPALSTERSSDPATVRDIFLKRSHQVPIQCFPSVPKAWAEIKSRKGTDADWILVVGSLYLAGESQKELRRVE